MYGEISWHVELRVRPGQLDNFRALTGEMLAVTRREPGVLSYQRFVSEDGAAVHLYERYSDSNAAVAQLGSICEALRAGLAQWLSGRLSLCLVTRVPS
jgi:quinol monooxygenase YgiN